MKDAGNYLNSCFRLKKFFELREAFKFLRRTAPTHNFAVKSEFFKIVVFRELLYYLNTLDFESALDSLNDIERDFERFKKFIPDARKFSFFYNISILYLLIGQTENASIWLDKILDRQGSDHRQDVQRIALFLDLVFNLDLNMKAGTFDHIPYMVEAVSRKYKNGDSDKSKTEKQSAPLSEFELLILDFCKDFIETPLFRAKR